jgi:orotidine-5'-phosphate decarboxylase
MHVSSQQHAADRLLDAIERMAAPACVGLDPVLERLPDAIGPRTTDAAASLAAIETFCLGVLDAVTGAVPCVKLQAACFERYRHRGVELMHRLIAAADQRGLEVILDAKRGDVGISAEHYAAGLFDEHVSTRAAGAEAADDRPDWVTINSYLGADGIEPFLRRGHGAFALVRTSNPGGDALQSTCIVGNETGAATVAERVAVIVAASGDTHLGHRGFSSLGAVVGATKPQDAARLRELMPRQIFLVPGYGAQGATASDIMPCFDQHGRGAIVSASRSVIFAFKPGDGAWRDTVREAALAFADEIGTTVRLR